MFEYNSFHSACTLEGGQPLQRVSLYTQTEANGMPATCYKRWHRLSSPSKADTLAESVLVPQYASADDRPKWSQQILNVLYKIHMERLMIHRVDEWDEVSNNEEVVFEHCGHGVCVCVSVWTCLRVCGSCAWWVGGVVAVYIIHNYVYTVKMMACLWLAMNWVKVWSVQASLHYIRQAQQQ